MTPRSINLPYGGGKPTVNWCIRVMDGDDFWSIPKLAAALQEAAQRILDDGFTDDAITVSIGTVDYEHQTPPLEMIARRDCTPQEAAAERQRVGSTERERLETQIRLAQANLARLERAAAEHDGSKP